MNFLQKINNAKSYALVTGGLLFILGLFGFAFRSSAILPDYYLILAIIFGLWGVIAAFN